MYVILGLVLGLLAATGAAVVGYGPEKLLLEIEDATGVEGLSGAAPQQPAQSVPAAPAAVAAPEAPSAGEIEALKKVEKLRDQLADATLRAQRAERAAEAAKTAALTAQESAASGAGQAAAPPQQAAPPAQPQAAGPDARPRDLALASVKAVRCDGESAQNGLFSIVGGAEVAFRSYLKHGELLDEGFPWAVSLRIVSSRGDANGVGEVSQRCGASAIADDWVLTAAHCLQPDRYQQIHVTAGSTDLNDPSAFRTTADMAICHAAFDHKFASLNNDIALVKLAEPLPPQIKRIPLAGLEYVHGLPKQAVAQAAGWGATGVDGDGLPEEAADKLKAVSLELREKNGSFLYVADPQRSVEGVCVGDSGGPLSVGWGDDARLVGVTSHVFSVNGRQCSTEDFQSVFTNVALFKDWVEDVIATCARRDDC